MAATATTGRMAFEPVDTSYSGPRDDVESPSLSSSNALARFEFEPGRSKDGTKVLMVEWQEDETSRAINADWEISWDDKRTVLPAKDNQSSQPTAQSPSQQPSLSRESTTASGASSTEEPINRMYFLLLPGMPVPTTVRLQKGPNLHWRTNPLPAIFGPELGATALTAGKKGVLHTHWAKKRLQVLQAEISAEERDNTEGVGLEMARAELEWIEQNFGVRARTAAADGGNAPNTAVASALPSSVLASSSTPSSPRLMDKLKGLKLGTSDRELTSSSPGLGQHNPLSPDASDVAVAGSGFGSFLELKGALPPTSSLAAKPAQTPAASAPRKFVAARPPTDAFGGADAGGMASLNAAFSDVPFMASATASNPTKGEDDEDDLFALPMSPRSPEMTKSPFSFAAQDVHRYAQGERV